MVGFLGTRGKEDESLIREVVRAVNDEVYGKHGGVSGRKMSKDVGKNGVKICVLDARGYASAFGNGYSGGGYEIIGTFDGREMRQQTPQNWFIFPSFLVPPVVRIRHIHVILKCHSLSPTENYPPNTTLHFWASPTSTRYRLLTRTYFVQYHLMPRLLTGSLSLNPLDG